MIVSFGDALTRDLFDGARTGRVRRIPDDVALRARHKLELLDAARELRDLASQPGNRLESLSGDWQGYWSIRVTRKWRFVFRWTAQGPTAVRLVDYH